MKTKKGIVISSEPEGKMWKRMGVELVHKCLSENGFRWQIQPTVFIPQTYIDWLSAEHLLPTGVFSPSFSGVIFFYLKSLHDVAGGT